MFSHTITPTNGNNDNNNNEHIEDMATSHDRLSHKLAELRRKRDRSSSAAADGDADDGFDIEFGPNNHVAVEEPIAEPFDTMTMASKVDIESTGGNHEESKSDDNKNIAAAGDAIQTITVTQYKALWSSLETAGSFQCKLKEAPSVHKLSEHMRKQGFHVVFASSNDNVAASGTSKVTPANSLAIAVINTASAGGGAIGVDQTGITTSSSTSSRVDIELGISNRRSTDTEPWFLARFIIANNIFSAVMKCQQVDDVPTHVKKFLLAKTLRIDTSSSTSV